MGGSRRQAGDDLRAGLTPVCRARTGRYLQADARAAHTLYLYLCRDENTPGTGSARQCVLVCCWYVVFNVRWCAYNTDYNTDNCVSKLLLDILLLRDLVLIHCGTLPNIKDRGGRSLSYSKVSHSARSQLALHHR